ncbi:unnamed protein product, partial [Rotaria socialis]
PSNMAGFPRPPLLPLPPSAPLLLRKNIEFKPAEQEILDNNFFSTFNMKQNEPKSQNSENTINNSRLYFLFS